MLKISKITDYLHLKDVGSLELLFAFSPILWGYGLMGLPLSILMWVVLIFLVFFHKGKIKTKSFKPFVLLATFCIAHDILLMVIADVNLNIIMSHVIFFVSVIALCPSIDVKKMRGSMNWVAIISIIGLLFQWTQIVRGNGVHPLELPGLEMSLSRLENLSLRPSSFYMEPAAYVAFMICPLAMALLERKFVWVAILILSIFLSTSTTGIVLSFIMLAITLISNRVKRLTSIAVVLLMGGGLFYALTTFEEFSLGVEKMESVDVSSNIRLSQGPLVVASMHTDEFILGVPYESAYKYCVSGRMTNVFFYGESVYMSTFWNMILLYGLVGLFLYLFVYFSLFKKSRLIWPFLICVCATMFSDPDTIGAQYVYKLIFMLVIVFNEKLLLNEISNQGIKHNYYGRSDRK